MMQSPKRFGQPRHISSTGVWHYDYTLFSPLYSSKNLTDVYQWLRWVHPAFLISWSFPIRLYLFCPLFRLNIPRLLLLRFLVYLFCILCVIHKLMADPLLNRVSDHQFSVVLEFNGPIGHENQDSLDPLAMKARPLMGRRTPNVLSMVGDRPMLVMFRKNWVIHWSGRWYGYFLNDYFINH